MFFLQWPIFFHQYLHHRTTFDLVGIIITFNMSRLPQSTFVDNHTDWFRSKQFTNLCVRFPLCHFKTRQPSKHTQYYPRHFLINALQFLHTSDMFALYELPFAPLNITYEPHFWQVMHKTDLLTTLFLHIQHGHLSLNSAYLVTVKHYFVFFWHSSSNL